MVTITLTVAGLRDLCGDINREVLAMIRKVTQEDVDYMRWQFSLGNGRRKAVP